MQSSNASFPTNTASGTRTAGRSAPASCRRSAGRGRARSRSGVTTCRAGRPSSGLTRLTGLAPEEATLLNLNVTDVSLDGLLVAGMVIGALGVLDDVTVSQASTVLALRAAAPAQRFGELCRSALIVGRDRVSATVSTLVLAYVGSSQLRRPRGF
jgi:YibE/F-like protein